MMRGRSWHEISVCGVIMRRLLLLVALVLAAAPLVAAQSGYQVIDVSHGGTIAGTVTWSGPQPHNLTFPVTKDPQVCDPDSRKRIDLERLLIGPNGGVANTVVYLKHIEKGKPLDIPQQRRFLDQKHCRYEPHILLVPKDAALQMKSSDATLHTVHMEGAASYNLPFPFPNQVVSRNMTSPGMVTLKCNGGHIWMNAEMFVIQHPYYAVTDESGKFELTDVPAGQYELVAWHEGWSIARQESSLDVLSEQRVQRPVFGPPRSWEKSVAVAPRETAHVNFVISDK
jgi:Polysaccharide lyase family 4, domain II